MGTDVAVGEWWWTTLPYFVFVFTCVGFGAFFAIIRAQEDDDV